MAPEHTPSYLPSALSAAVSRTCLRTPHTLLCAASFALLALLCLSALNGRLTQRTHTRTFSSSRKQCMSRNFSSGWRQTCRRTCGSINTHATASPHFGCGFMPHLPAPTVYTTHATSSRTMPRSTTHGFDMDHSPLQLSGYALQFAHWLFNTSACSSRTYLPHHLGCLSDRPRTRPLHTAFGGRRHQVNVFSSFAVV